MHQSVIPRHIYIYPPLSLCLFSPHLASLTPFFFPTSTGGESDEAGATPDDSSLHRPLSPSPLSFFQNRQKLSRSFLPITLLPLPSPLLHSHAPSPICCHFITLPYMQPDPPKAKGCSRTTSPPQTVITTGFTLHHTTPPYRMHFCPRDLNKAAT